MSEIKVVVSFDFDAFYKEFTKRLSLRSASEYDAVLKSMEADVQRFVIIGEPPDALNSEFIGN